MAFNFLLDDLAKGFVIAENYQRFSNSLLWQNSKWFQGAFTADSVHYM